jgi:tetratricopeptide (TPR) repeat protein
MTRRLEWFRNTEWNDRIAAEFAARLSRARRKEQYIRIQASYLSRTHPNAALELLDQYFRLNDTFEHAAAFVAQAEAYLALGNVAEALTSYEAALSRETEFPRLKTLAYVEYPYLIATRDISSHYKRALEVLEQRKEDLMFPADHFMWHAARALIQAAVGMQHEARAEARAALEAAARDHSGFRHHPHIGLVSERHAEALRRLKAFHDA